VPDYQFTPVAPRFDGVTAVLGIMALAAVLGLIVLWLLVWSAYAS
jgi:hypothetical protein